MPLLKNSESQNKYKKKTKFMLVSRNSGLNEGQPKSCFGSSIPNAMSFSLPTEVGQVFLSGLEVAKGRGPWGPRNSR